MTNPIAPATENDQWITIKRNSKSIHKNTRYKPTITSSNSVQHKLIDVQQFNNIYAQLSIAHQSIRQQPYLDTINQKYYQLKHHQYFQHFISTLQQTYHIQSIQCTCRCHIDPHNNNNNVQQLICYGIGSITTSIVAQLQFVLLLHLVQYYNTISPSGCTILIYDPICNQLEVDIMKYYNIEYMSSNDVGLHTVYMNTLFYLPHCTSTLYNNIVTSNSHCNLHNLCIIGNNFQYIIDQCNDKNSSVAALKDILHDTVITPTNDSLFDRVDTFNDMYIHTFNNPTVPHTTCVCNINIGHLLNTNTNQYDGELITQQMQQNATM